MWMKLEDIVLSEVGKEQIQNVLSHMCNVKKPILKEKQMIKSNRIK